jgi:hypothetical protein
LRSLASEALLLHLSLALEVDQVDLMSRATTVDFQRRCGRHLQLAQLAHVEYVLLLPLLKMQRLQLAALRGRERLRPEALVRLPQLEREGIRLLLSL